MVLLKRMSTSSQYKEASDLGREKGGRIDVGGLRLSGPTMSPPPGGELPEGWGHQRLISVSPIGKDEFTKRAREALEDGTEEGLPIRLPES
jgi:hypothetical protein